MMAHDQYLDANFEFSVNDRIRKYGEMKSSAVSSYLGARVRIAIYKICHALKFCEESPCDDFARLLHVEVGGFG